jgi:hypothetical protein
MIMHHHPAELFGQFYQYLDSSYEESKFTPALYLFPK